jgi:hypothetical protein
LGDTAASTPIPVYAIWHEHVGPALSLGMLTASARHWNGGELNEQYEIRRPERADEALKNLRGRRGPAVLLCSNYVWSLDANLAVAAEAVAVSSEVVIVHGGPSTPKYPDDGERFLHDHERIAHLLVRGEGEEALCELLEALPDPAHPGRLSLDADRLGAVAGITFRDRETSAIVRTEDRARLADLDRLPSPYLTGEFDGIDPGAWKYCLSIETNRGCPYGCTFCDWGSATMSRIRKFDVERVVAEFEWAARLGAETVTITDANFGIMSRDVQLAREFSRVRQESGWPQSISWTAAKNTTKHLVRIMDEFSASGMAVSTSLSLQTIDPGTLEVIARTNISTDHYVKMAADYRRRGYPLQGDLMLGLPGQSFESFKADLQFMQDHEIMVRCWPTQLLPNAPMNDPTYRERHQLLVDELNVVRSSATFDREARTRMWRFRTVDTLSDRLGILRHVLRYLQWDHGLRATDVEERILDLIDEEPTRFPLLSWVYSYFDLFPTVACGWLEFYGEVRGFIVEEYGIAPDDPGLATVIAIQFALMPAPGREFPHVIELEHDYVAYYRSATRTLYTTGKAGVPDALLTSYGPASFEVRGDPLGLCTIGIHPAGDPRSEIMQGDLHVGAAVANELDSDLIRVLPALSLHGFHPMPTWSVVDGEVLDGLEGDDLDLDGNITSEAVPVVISSQR